MFKSHFLTQRLQNTATAMPASVDSINIFGNGHSFDADGSPRGADVRGRLDLSLDALIKERRNVHKLLKHEVKKRKEMPARKIKQQQRQQQQRHQQQHVSIVKDGQKAHRKAVVNKNRGLPALSVASKNRTAHGKTKTGIPATPANLRRQSQADKSTRSSSNRQVVSKMSIRNIASPLSLKKKNARRQERKVTSYAYVKQPKSGQKLQVQKARLKSETERPIRQVVRTGNDKSRLSITVVGRKKFVNKKTRAR